MPDSLIDISVPAESQEGTTMKVQAWLKQPGDTVKQFEPLVEMETDKVMMEIEAPADGVLHEILVKEGAEVSPEMIIARLNVNQAATSSPPQAVVAAEDSKKAALDRESINRRAYNLELSPAVKRYVSEYNIDIGKIDGTGKNNRITLNDLKQFQTTKSKQLDSKQEASISKMVPHTSMRRSIAEHMANSLTEAPHVTAIFEADFTAIAAHREKLKPEFAARGVKLSYTAYILMACVQAMRTVPEVNSRWHNDATEIFSDINIGVGTALGDKGLVVPVLKGIQNLGLFDIAKELQNLTDKARNNTLSPSDMRGGTFTISNHGVSGSLLATPIIINQRQSAILGVGKLEKRVVVRTVGGQDSLLIKPMAYVSLTIDHRIIDGHQTNAWLSKFVSTLELWDDE